MCIIIISSLQYSGTNEYEMRTNTLMDNVGFNIAERRRELKITQEELSNRADISTNYVSRLERGEVQHIRAETLAKIAEALDTTMDALFNGKSDLGQKRALGKYEKQLYTTLNQLDQGTAEEVSKSILKLINTKLNS
ncbi:MAG TPA: helix-turn-helix transcriptional regulator [Limosilactobacillus coleohominis]|nr:helix-turn-helix transcriptional regulator [Limosilactobacillus coleohominis]